MLLVEEDVSMILKNKGVTVWFQIDAGGVSEIYT